MDAQTLEWKENQANIALLMILQERIEDITQTIESRDIRQLIECKQEIQKDIRQCGQPVYSFEMIEWLDSVNIRICNAFVERCQSSSDKFEENKRRITLVLGDHGKRLPKDAFDTLATAELLFNEYAEPDIEEKGFDYSSISALYYQAFEKAYNEMIWKSYADKVNSLIDNRCPRPVIYHDYFPGDLDTDDKDRINEVVKKIKQYYFKGGRVKPYCVFGSFSFLMDEIKTESTAPKYCDHIAFLAGYDNKTKMLEDQEFMRTIIEFTDIIKEATPKRNDASHGGMKIDFIQCEEDKRTVLSELETVRNNSLGLIQRLLIIIKRKYE